jgi:hypothetical protein
MPATPTFYAGPITLYYVRSSTQLCCTVTLSGRGQEQPASGLVAIDTDGYLVLRT